MPNDDRPPTSRRWGRRFRSAAIQLLLIAGALGAFVVVARVASRRMTSFAPPDAAPNADAATSTSTTTATTMTTSPAAPTDAHDPPDPRPLDAATPFASGDASYVEDDCDTLADVSAIASGYAPTATRATLEALARTRYPSGLPFIEAQTDAQLQTWLGGTPDSFDRIASRFEVVVHEGSHLWGIKRWNGRTITYPVTSALTIETRALKNFNRTEILARHVDAAADSYAKTYLEGTSGAQGFNSLLDEYNAYTHSLASRYCTRDLLAAGTRISGRDGILTMMYYVETYLAIARELHPADYAAIVADAGHRRLILTVWDRAELWLRRSATHRSLGVADDRITPWVYEPTRLAEIARVRDADVTTRDH